ncbi:hypothetical protein [Abyssalbus ytuae]|uniref:Uncharacterized protein n=1 Tax=Abyssalbus ytuae TaxID=2926907 RepID=A0A9E6ZVM6_9FLAO|nr:hypothetical protein [Abyssalbus ytuae]UOB18613.1 hypothetical protein MQE35_04820 [Abyssalbus ytuae]
MASERFKKLQDSVYGIEDKKINIPEGLDTTNLRECKGIGIDKQTGKLRKGFIKLKDGKIVSEKKLLELIEDHQNNDQ